MPYSMYRNNSTSHPDRLLDYIFSNYGSISRRVNGKKKTIHEKL